MDADPISHPHDAGGPPARQSACGATPLPGQPLDSDALFQGRTTLWIRHNGEVYVLRATNAGNLKLTK